MEHAFDLVAGYGRDPRITRIVTGVRTFVFPVVNPDGLVASQTTGPGTDPFKRRNCDGGTATLCGPGVDLNRNYGAFWGGPGASDDPGSDTYRGPAPFSESETRALHAFSASHQVMVIDSVHNYGGTVLYQPGFATVDEPGLAGGAPLPGHERMAAVAGAMAQAAGYVAEPAWSAASDITGAMEDWNSSPRARSASRPRSATSLPPGLPGRGRRPVPGDGGRPARPQGAAPRLGGAARGVPARRRGRAEPGRPRGDRGHGGRRTAAAADQVLHDLDGVRARGDGDRDAVARRRVGAARPARHDAHRPRLRALPLGRRPVDAPRRRAGRARRGVAPHLRGRRHGHRAGRRSVVVGFGGTARLDVPCAGAGLAVSAVARHRRTVVVRLATSGGELTHLRLSLDDAHGRLRAAAGRERVPARLVLRARVPAGAYVLRAAARDATGGTVVVRRRVRLR